MTAICFCQDTDFCFTLSLDRRHFYDLTSQATCKQDNSRYRGPAPHMLLIWLSKLSSFHHYYGWLSSSLCLLSARRHWWLNSKPFQLLHTWWKQMSHICAKNSNKTKTKLDALRRASSVSCVPVPYVLGFHKFALFSVWQTGLCLSWFLRVHTTSEVSLGGVTRVYQLKERPFKLDSRVRPLAVCWPLQDAAPGVREHVRSLVPARHPLKKTNITYMQNSMLIMLWIIHQGGKEELYHSEK